MILKREFFERDADIVAKDLLGKVLVRKLNGKELRAKIVETEAYFDENDSASRARQNGNLREVMLKRPGTLLTYGVHNSWLINIVTKKEGVPEAVLIRAVEPLNFSGKTSGPGLLCKALKIDKKFHDNDLLSHDSLWLEEGGKNLKIVSSKRIGVKKDLEEDFRFFIKGNKFVSR